MNDFEQQWAITIKKNQQKAQMPVLTRKNNVLEKIDLLKTKLKKNIQENNTLQIRENYQELIQLRARLAVLEILEIEKDQGYADDDEKNAIISTYASDCLKLKSSLNKFL